MENFSSALVTGATGFIGKRLTQRLIKLGISTTCLVREQSNCQYLPKEARIIIIPHFDAANITAALRDTSVKAIFHLAAYGVRPEQRDPIEMAQANIMATAALVTAAQHWPLRRIIYTGSCAEYGAIKNQSPIKENHALNALSIYGAAKTAASIYGTTLAAQLGFPFTTLRLFDIYGPGEADYRLIPYFIQQLTKKSRVDLTPGEQVRDFLHVDDAVDALLAAANSTTLESDPYNVCSSIPVTIRDIALQVAAMLDYPATKLDFGARTYRSDETMYMVGDNTAFCTATHWSPKVSLQDGILSLIAHH